MTNDIRPYTYSEQTLLTIIQSQQWQSDGDMVHNVGGLIPSAANAIAELFKLQGVSTARAESLFPPAGESKATWSVMADEKQFDRFCERHGLKPKKEPLFTDYDKIVLKEMERTFGQNEVEDWRAELERELSERSKKGKASGLN